jgi:hypothetical protein
MPPAMDITYVAAVAPFRVARVRLINPMMPHAMGIMYVLAAAPSQVVHAQSINRMMQHVTFIITAQVVDY